MKKTLGELRRLNPRDIWPSESSDFTPWLAENIDRLGEALGMDLEVTETEAAVGEFSVDILAKDLATGRDVVIENQYSATDHDHLGKLLTYASGMDAYALVWIAQDIRDEHRQAIAWLNERTDEDTLLFAIELEVLQIDDSAPAHNFKLVVFPNKWQKTTHRGASSAPSARGEAYRLYFQQLIDDLREKHKFTGARVAFPQGWHGFASGLSGVTYNTSFAQGGRVRTEVYIDRGDAETNKKLFDKLAEDRERIEADLDARLDWERLDDRKASRIALYRPGSIESDDATLLEIRSWAIENLLKFKKVFGPLLKEHPK